MTPVAFVVPGAPVPFARSGGGKNTPRFTPARQRNGMASIRLFASRAMGDRPPMEGPIRLMVVATYLKPASWSRGKAERNRFKVSKPDIDNVVKLVKDACNKIVWVDDAQVCVCVQGKVYASREEVRVYVRPAVETDLAVLAATAPEEASAD